jgi:flagellar basal body-associated protein FliL
MEYGYWPDTQIEKEIKKSKRTIVISSIILFVLFSSAIVGNIFYFGRKETKFVNNKLDVLTEKVDGMLKTQSSVVTSLGLINHQLNKTIDDTKVVISGVGLVSNRSNPVNSKMDTIVFYIKK